MSTVKSIIRNFNKVNKGSCRIANFTINGKHSKDKEFKSICFEFCQSYAGNMCWYAFDSVNDFLTWWYQFEPY